MIFDTDPAAKAEGALSDLLLGLLALAVLATSAVVGGHLCDAVRNHGSS